MYPPHRKVITTLNGDPAQPLGLAAYPDQRSGCVRVAHQGGVNFFFFYSLTDDSVAEGLLPLLRRSREHIIVATGSGARGRNGLDRALRSIFRRLGVDTLDIFFAEYVSPSDDTAQIFDRGGVLDVICEWRRDEAIRYAGATTHSRELALRLIDDGRIDVLMHRFNMAHRRAADSVFPAAHAAGIPVVAFTATRWQTLLNGHPAWSGPVPSASDCYRYCLTAPAVQVVLSSPTTPAQVRENLVVLERNGLEPDSVAAWEAYGDLVYGDGRSAFETQWP